MVNILEPTDNSISVKEYYKISKYRYLQIEIEKMHNRVNISESSRYDQEIDRKTH